jgi:PmbA protein
MIDVELAQRAVKLALDGGATDAECTLSEGDEFSAQVRMRSLESLQDSAGRGAGIRVLAGKRSGSAYTSDLSSEGIAQMVRSALEIAAITGDDPHAGLPDPDELGSLSGDLDLYSDDVAAVSTDRRIELARETEEAGFAYDTRIVNSEGAGFDAWAAAIAAAIVRCARRWWRVKANPWNATTGSRPSALLRGWKNRPISAGKRLNAQCAGSAPAR